MPAAARDGQDLTPHDVPTSRPSRLSRRRPASSSRAAHCYLRTSCARTRPRGWLRHRLDNLTVRKAWCHAAALQAATAWTVLLTSPCSRPNSVDQIHDGARSQSSRTPNQQSVVWLAEVLPSFPGARPPFGRPRQTFILSGRLGQTRPLEPILRSTTTSAARQNHSDAWRAPVQASPLTMGHVSYSATSQCPRRRSSR